MANEISINLSVTVSISGQSATGTVTSSDNASTFIGNEQTIGTAAETLTFVDVGSPPAFLFVRNMDSTNYVEVDSVNTFDSFPQKILAGRGVFLYPQTGTIYAKANTSSVKCWIVSAS